jgi:hypothetical protein
MTLRRSCTRTAAIALAAAALAAPAASARPTDISAVQTEASVPAQPPQDLRSPDTRDVANGYTPPPVQDLRSPDTRDVAKGYQPTAATGRHGGISTTTWTLLIIGVIASAAVLGTVAHGRRTRIPV